MKLRMFTILSKRKKIPSHEGKQDYLHKSGNTLSQKISLLQKRLEKQVR